MGWQLRPDLLHFPFPFSLSHSFEFISVLLHDIVAAISLNSSCSISVVTLCPSLTTNKNSLSYSVQTPAHPQSPSCSDTLSCPSLKIYGGEKVPARRRNCRMEPRALMLDPLGPSKLQNPHQPSIPCMALPLHPPPSSHKLLLQIS